MTNISCCTLVIGKKSLTLQGKVYSEQSTNINSNYLTIMRQKIFFILSLLGIAIGNAWAQDVTTVTYALQEGDTFTSGQEVEVTNDAGEVVASIVFGEEGGNAFTAAVVDNHVSGFTAYTPGNNTNGNKVGGTFYTIKPLVDGTIDVAVVLNGSKPFYIIEDGTALADFNGITVTDKYYGTYTFAAKAGSSYKVYCSGSKLGFYGFNLNISAGNDDDEPIVNPDDPTESTSLLSYTLVQGDETFEVGVDLAAGNGFVQFGTDKREPRESGLYGFKSDGDPGSTKYILLKPARALQVGDIISITMFATSNPSGSDYGFSLFDNKENGATPLASLFIPAKIKETLYTGTYTVTDGDGLSGLEEIYLYRSQSKSTYFVAAEIVGANQGGDEPTPTPGISKTWNFSNWVAQDFTETTTIDGLTVLASSDKKVTIDGTNKTYDGVSYTQRLKFGGAGSATVRTLTFELPTNTKVTVIATHASGSGDPRPLNLATGSFGSVAASTNCYPGEISELTYTNKGETTTAFIYSGNSGINLYAIYLTPVTDEEVVNVEIGSAEYATLYYSDKAFKFPANVTASYISAVSENGLIEMEAIGNEERIIPAGTGVILQGKPNKYEFTVVNVNMTAPDDNLLKGTDEAAETTGGDKYYKLTVKNDVVGFYYGAEDGAAFTNGAHKAYLAVTGAAAKYYVFNGEATGINAVEKAIAADGAIYNLQGVRVDAHNMVKGIYVVNGKKVVIK